MTRKCAQWECMNEFTPNSYNQIYCSSKCSKIVGKEKSSKRRKIQKSDKKKLEYFYKR